MSTALRRPMSLEAFLAWEERQQDRWEFDGFAPVAMVGVTLEHSSIQVNLAFALTSQLRGTPCRFHGPEVKLRTAETIRYPDGFVKCTPAQRGQTVVDDPVIVFEILSPGTAHVDHGDKAREYRTIPALRRYVMLRQDRMAAEVHARDGESDRWLSLLLSEGQALALPEIGVEIPLAELYEGVALPPRGAATGSPLGAP